MKRVCIAAVAAALVSLSDSARSAPAPHDVRQAVFNIDAPTLGAALLQFGQQSGLQVVCPAEVIAGRRATKISGALSPKMVLDQLLKGSGLKYVFVNERTVSITVATPLHQNSR